MEDRQNTRSDETWKIDRIQGPDVNLEDRQNTRTSKRGVTWKIDRIHGIDVNLEDRQNERTSDSDGDCLLPLGLKE
jgi:hypothetical protein